MTKVIPPSGGTPTPSKPPPPPPQPTTMNPTQWADLVARDLGINIQSDPNAVQDILAWMPHEENTSQWWGGFGTASDPTRINPLNAGDLGHFGYHGVAATGNQLGGGLGGYNNLTDAASATAQMISQGNMSAILQALQSGDTTAQFSQALESSPWAASHYGGAVFTPGQAAAEARGPTVTAGAGPGGVVGSAANQSQQQANAVNQTLQDYLNQFFVQNKTIDDALMKQMQLSQSDEAIQKQILQQNYQYSQEQAKIEEQQLGLNITENEQQSAQLASQRGFQLQQDVLSGQEIGTAIANIVQNYGFQQQQLAQQKEQGLSSQAAAGLTNTGAHGQFLGAQALAESQAAASERQALVSEQQQLHQLGITEQAQQSQYGYSQQQLANGLRNLRLQQQSLGISEAQAHTQYLNALQQLGLSNMMGATQLEQQIAQLVGGGYSPAVGIINQLQSLIPGVAGLIGGSGGAAAAGLTSPTGG